MYWSCCEKEEDFGEDENLQLDPHFKHGSEDGLDVRAAPVKKPGSYQVDLPGGGTTFVVHTLTLTTTSTCFTHISSPLLLITTTNIARHTITTCLNDFSLVHGSQRNPQESDEASV